ncbi:MAG: hypothetical protein JWQ71_2473 [Pedosphaera sp.]|nr:hypothetical protein [Pedosphaera sp.]
MNVSSANTSACLNPNRSFRLLAALTTLSCFGLKAPAEPQIPSSTTPDKNEYSLFHPTPDSLMRPFATDRPDKTESPYTVDAGHFQFEMDLLNYSYDRYSYGPGNFRNESISIGPLNMKVGLCNTADLQLVIQPYNHFRTHDLTSGAVQNQSGFGDLITRLKVNLWGNDGGTTAFGVMPFLKLPTNQHHLGNNSLEGGLILPLWVELPQGWEMGLMAEVDLNVDASGSGYHAEYIHSIAFSHGIIGKLSGYAEFFSALSAEVHSPWVTTVDFGFTYLLTENVQLDAGINLGITRSADDLNPFTGISVRF